VSDFSYDRYALPAMTPLGQPRWEARRAAGADGSLDLEVLREPLETVARELDWVVVGQDGTIVRPADDASPQMRLTVAQEGDDRVYRLRLPADTLAYGTSRVIVRGVGDFLVTRPLATDGPF